MMEDGGLGFGNEICICAGLGYGVLGFVGGNRELGMGLG